jgi:hypothetical protein
VLSVVFFYKLTTAGNIFAPLPHAQRGAPMVLGGDPKGKTFLYAQDKAIIVRDIEVTKPFCSGMHACFLLLVSRKDCGVSQRTEPAHRLHVQRALHHHHRGQVLAQRLLHCLGWCVSEGMIFADL